MFLSADEGVTMAGFTEKFKTYVVVNSEGVNMWMSPATFKSSCDMVIRMYPFDTQNCKLTFGSWTFDSRLLKIITRDKKHSKSGRNTNSILHITCHTYSFKCKNFFFF